MNKVISLAVSTIFSVTLLLGASAYAELGGENVAKFIGDDEFSRNIYDLHNRAGTQGAPKNQPWSGTFWPLRSGSTANTYNTRLDFKLNQLFGAKANLRKFHRRIDDLRSQAAKGKLSEQTIRDMAPAEKYDLFIGDENFSYTQAEWQSVSEQLDYIGAISLWEGSCHGWSTAAIYEPRPKKLFSVISLDGKYVIPFYPDDLKALSTRLWANSLIQDYTVAQGKRCTAKKPKQDGFTGKVMDETCEGVNPGDFHVSVLEIVGARKESFVVNRSNTRQVWNQPVAGYELNYFNPITEKDGDLTESVVSRSGYADPYVKFRDPAVKAVVGVEMKLRYVSETNPSHKKEDEAENDKIKTLKVRYDLELDESNQVIGGEWRKKKDPKVPEDFEEKFQAGEYDDETSDIPQYPGFLWKFQDSNPVALSVADVEIPGEDLTEMDRNAIVQASKKAAQFRYNVYNWDEETNKPISLKRAELKPQPLGKVVNFLVKLAQ